MAWTGVLVYVQAKRKKKNAHHSEGRLKDLLLAACITADRTDSSMLWAAKMEGIVSSKEVGSSTSAGIRLSKSSTVRFWLEVDVGVEVEAGWAGVGSGSSDIVRGDEGALNLAMGLSYGLGCLHDEVLELEFDVEEETHPS